MRIQQLSRALAPDGHRLVLLDTHFQTGRPATTDLGVPHPSYFLQRLTQRIDVDAEEIALVENIQRHDLNAIEEAEGIKRLMNEFGFNQEQAAKKIGRSRTAVTNILRLLNLQKNY